MRRLFLVIVLALMAAGGRAQTGYEAIRLPALRELAAQLSGGDLAAAVVGLRAYLVDHPCDATMQYNLACVENRLQQSDAALTDLARALALGYRDLKAVRRDPDLASLAGDPRFSALLSAHRDTLLARRDRASRVLDEGQWSDWIALVALDGTCSEAPSLTEARFCFTNALLRVEVRRPAGALSEGRVVVAVPTDPDAVESDRTRTFEMAGGGTLRRTRRNGRADPGPVRAIQDDAHGWRLAIPWGDLDPLGPPLDAEVGLNLVVDGAALVPDPYVGSWHVPWRRFALLTLMPAFDAAPALRGRLNTTVLVGDTLRVDLAEQGLAEGTARLTLRATAGWAPAAGADGIVDTREVVLEPDLSFLDTSIALGDLSSSCYRLGVELCDASGQTATWTTTGVRLEPDWFVRTRVRLAHVPPAEQSIVDRWLFFVLRSLPRLDPREDPRVIARPMAIADSLLARAERSGSVLVSGTRLDVAFPVGGDTFHAAVLHVPPNYRPGAAAHGLVLFAPTDATVATRVGLTDDPTARSDAAVDAPPQRPTPWAFAGGDEPVVLVVGNLPQPADPQYARQVVAAATAWLAQLCRAPEVTVCAWRQAGAPVLRAMLSRPVLADAVRLLPDGPLDPWPGADIAGLADRIAPATATSPSLTIIAPPGADTRLAAFARVLERRQYVVHAVPAAADAAGDAHLLWVGR